MFKCIYHIIKIKYTSKSNYQIIFKLCEDNGDKYLRPFKYPNKDYHNKFVINLSYYYYLKRKIYLIYKTEGII
jgi:hypothetical protein